MERTTSPQTTAVHLEAHGVPTREPEIAGLLASSAVQCVKAPSAVSAVWRARRGQVVVEEDARDEFLAGAYVGLLEQAFDVVLDGVGGED